MSLQHPHPLWTTCGSNSYEICKATIQARMLSGRYRTDQLLRHFSDNDGSCSLCKDDNISGSIKHLLVHCSALTDTRNNLIANLAKNTKITKETKYLIKMHFDASEEDQMQLILDPSVLPRVISLKQTEGHQVLTQLFSFSRSWCYSIYKVRLKLLGRWLKI